MAFRIDVALRPLFDLSPSETVPILLELAREQSQRKRPADLMAQYGRDGFVEPSKLDLRLAHRLDGIALEAASAFEALLLSPVAPLGVCSVVAPSSQDRTLSTTRNTEVVSDPTNVLALECARRLAKEPSTPVRLCTVHQVVRAQALPPKPGFSRHFRMFALAEAGAALPNHAFEVQAIVRHVAITWRVFELCASLGCRFPQRRATLFSSPAKRALADRIKVALAAAFPELELAEESFDSAYYDGVRVLSGASSNVGDHIPLADTGVFDWMGKLTSNQRLRFIASGMGIQLIPVLFTTPPAGGEAPVPEAS